MNLKMPLQQGGEIEKMLADVRDFKKVSAFGMQFYNRVLTAASLGGGVYVCADFVIANKVFLELKCVTNSVVFLPAIDDVIVYHKNMSGENLAVRLSALKAIAEGVDFVVTTAEALTQLYPNKRNFSERIIKIKRGEEYDIFDLSSQLVLSGYHKETQIAAAGQFSVRGDILDVWSVGNSQGYRIEFFGDEAEKIRLFDIGDQTTSEDIPLAEICPNTEVFLSGIEAQTIANSLSEQLKKVKEPSEHLINTISDVTISLLGDSRDKSLSYIMPLTSVMSLYEFCEGMNFIYDDAKSVFDAVKMTYTEHYSRIKSYLAKAEILPLATNQLIAEEKVFLHQTCGALAFHSINSANRIFDPQAVYNFKTMTLGDYSRDFDSLLTDVKNWSDSGSRVFIYCGTADFKARMSAFFSDHHVRYSYDGSAPITLLDDFLEHGAIFFDDKIIIIGTQDLTRASVTKTLKRSKKDIFSEVAVGDYVVHNIHGIGVCDQIAKLELSGVSRDYIVVRYNGGDKLYVPIENIDSLSKLVSGEETPKLSKIGGADFALVKERVQKSVKAMAINLLELYAIRKQAVGHAYSEDNSLLDEFSADFGYTETDDQLTAIADGLKDLTSGKIMDRLLCGDVGYGKTEVALRLAFKVIAEGKQVAFIAPTTILARQHYNTCYARLERFGIKTGSLTRFDSALAQQKTLEGLNCGKVEMVCGTHRILSKDVLFKDLGLLILDEEQRFGVADKEKIKKLKSNVNVLSLSATPIPRTLHMSMVGIRDISILDTPPADRIPVQTYVTEYTETLAVDAINREVNRGGQVFVVYNRVAEIDKFATTLMRLLPSVKFSVAHGQMDEKRLENIIADFTAGKTDVLVASTIIENGIDIALANTMIVVDADRLGLSQLYQLRGRVGRSNRLSYVYFTYDGAKILTETAYKRLSAITEFTEFGSGFKIAMRDLEIRGAGNILGREQHGHIEKVGYDMYCKLLENAVHELKGEATENIERPDLKIITDFNAFIPDYYVVDKEWRVRLYTRIARLQNNAERVGLINDLNDIYGKPPDSVSNLIFIGLIKNLASKIGASSVTIKKSECFITLTKIKDLSQQTLKIIQTTNEIKLDMTKSRLIFASGAQGIKSMLKFLTAAG